MWWQGGPTASWGRGLPDSRNGWFAEWLVSRGYAAGTVAGYLRWLGWLGGWLAGRGLAADALTGALAAEFAASMRAAGHPKITAGRLATMLGYLREAGAVPPEDPCPSEVTPRERVLAAYREHMARRGLAPVTVATRLRVAGMFLDGLGGDTAADGVEHLTPRQVLAVLRSWGPLARRRSSELRAFLRYLRAAGHTAQDLAAVVFPARPGSAPRRAARLDPAQAVAVLDGFERAEELPLLSVDAGLALAEYLRARSPAAGTRAVFVTTVAACVQVGMRYEQRDPLGANTEQPENLCGPSH